MHAHVHCSNGEAKYWLEPAIGPTRNYGLSRPQLNDSEWIIEAHYDELQAAWKRHFCG